MKKNIMITSKEGDNPLHRKSPNIKKGDGSIDLQSYSCSRPARENVMNAHGETRLFLVVVNQPKIQ